MQFCFHFHKAFDVLLLCAPQLRTCHTPPSPPTKNRNPQLTTGVYVLSEATFIHVVRHTTESHGGFSQPRFEPEGCSTVLGVVEGGDHPPPAFVDPNLWVGGSGGQPPGSPGGGGGILVGTPTYIPQNDPHDALIFLNIHKWGTKFFQKNSPVTSGSHQPRSDPKVGSGSKSCLVLFIHF